MDWDIRHFRIVVAISEHRSISRAASELGMSQPNASAQIRRLERRLGGPMLIRSARGVELTALGRIVASHARSVLATVDALDGDLNHLTALGSPLRLAANYTEQFSGLLEQLVERGLQREFSPVVNVSTSRLTRGLIEGWVDMGLVGVHPGFDDEPPAPIQQLTIVDEEPFFVVLSARHPAASHHEVDLSDLGADAWLLPPGEPDGTDAAMRAAFAAAGINPSTPYGHVDVEQFWPYVENGRVVAVTLPTRMPPRHLDIVVRPLVGKAISGRQVVRWHPRRSDRDEALRVAQAAAVAFEQQLKDTAMKRSWWDECPTHRPSIVTLP